MIDNERRAKDQVLRVNDLYLEAVESKKKLKVSMKNMLAQTNDLKAKIDELEEKLTTQDAFYKHFMKCFQCGPTPGKDCQVCKGDGKLPRYQVTNLWYFVGSDAIHQAVACANCDASPLRGVRYHCAKCKVDLCGACEALRKHAD